LIEGNIAYCEWNLIQTTHNQTIKYRATANEHKEMMFNVFTVCLDGILVFIALRVRLCLSFAEFFIIPRLKMTLAPSWLLHFLQQGRSNCHTCTDEIQSSLETECTFVHYSGLAEHTTVSQTKRCYIKRVFTILQAFLSPDTAQIAKIFIIQFSQVSYYLLPLNSNTCLQHSQHFVYLILHTKFQTQENSRYVMANQCDYYKELLARE
jgi:hypothetical protein